MDDHISADAADPSNAVPATSSPIMTDVATSPPEPAPSSSVVDEEEARRRKKYPIGSGAGRSALLERRMSRGVPKFFDSGDYALSKIAKDPQHKNKPLVLSYPPSLGDKSASSSSSSPSNSPAAHPLVTPNPLIPTGNEAAANSAAVDEAPRPPTAITLQHRRLSRQRSKLVDDGDLATEAIPA